MFTASLPAQAAVGDGTLTVNVMRTFTEVGVANPKDVPQPGMQVLVTDASGASVSGVTDAAGNVVIPADPTLSGGQYRVEVTIPAEYSYLQPAFATLASPYGSHVGFVNVSGGTNVTYRTAVWNPADYVQVNPRLAVPLQAGDGASASTQALVEFASSPKGNIPARTVTNRQGQVGTVYGTAYDRYTERLFSSAYAKRHSAYGPGGSGAVYVSPLSSATATLFATIPNAGPTTHTLPLRRDASFFTAPGREGLGDIEMSEDGSTLWVVNMYDKQLYGLDAATGAITSTAPIPDPGCVGGEWHPMGLGVQDGKVYVGGICDAFTSQLRTDLMASVYESLDGVSFTKILDHSLDFLRGRANDPGVVDVNTHWNPWYDQWDSSKYYSAWVHAFPQPLLSDIDFDRDGSLLLGFRDRFGDQIGYDGLTPAGQSEGAGSSAAGDIIKVCMIGGSFVWEGEGVCPSNVVPTYTGGTANGLTSEYFVGESVLGSNHQEPGLGSIAPIFRDNNVVMTTIDPLQGAWQQGVQYLDLTDGTGAYAQGGRGGSSRGQLLSSGALTFGKGNGLGDLSVLADPAPIQIGNVVWFDEDKDGTQDPGEVPLPGVKVDLLADDGVTVLSTATTNANGEYYFSSLTSPLTPNGEFRVKFTKPADGVTVNLGATYGVVDWARLSLTDQIQGSNSSIDSNPDATTGVTPPILTGAPGADDHTIDAGYVLERLPAYEHSKTSVPVPGTPVVGGDTITYTVIGSNTGDLALAVDIADDLSGVLSPGSTLTGAPVATVYNKNGSTVAGTPAAAVTGIDLTWSGSVPSGGRVEIVYTVTVNADVAPGTVFVNLMSSVATPPPGDWPPTIEPEPVTLEHPVPGFVHSKTSDPGANVPVLGTAPNNEITYTVRGDNIGATPLDVVMEDDLSQVLEHSGIVTGAITSGPTAVVYNEDGSVAGGVPPAATISGTTMTWTGPLAPGQYVEIVYTVTLDADIPGNIVVQNALSSYATPPGGDPIVPDDITISNPTPDYAHSKTSVPLSGTTVLPGQTIAYTVTGYNTGATAMDVAITDDLSSVLNSATLLGAITATVYAADNSVVSSAPVSLAGTNLNWSGTLQIGQRVEITYSVQVNAGVTPGAIIQNTMTSQADAGGDVLLPDPPTITTTHPVAGYEHVKSSAPSPGTAVFPGDQVIYTVMGSNTGGAVLNPVVITDDLSAVTTNATLQAGVINGVVYAADDSIVSTTPATLTGDVLTWTGTLQVGEYVELVYAVTVNDGASGVLVNHLSSAATPEGQQVPITPEDVELEHPIPGYVHEKSSSPLSGTPVVAGDEITYTLGGTNTGSTTLDPVEITDDLSGVLVGGVTSVGTPVARIFDEFGDEVTGSIPDAVITGTTLTWTGSLPAGSRVEITYTVRLGADVAPGTVLVNALTSTGTTPDGTVITPEEEVEQHPVPGIDIVKFDGRNPVDIPADPVDGPSALGATPGDWAAAVDADTEFDAAQYPVSGDGTTGPQAVSMIVTNTGAVALSNLNLSDATLEGPDLANLQCDFSLLGGPATGTTWAGPLAPGASFACTGQLNLTAPETHSDRASVTADAVVTLPGGEVVTVPVTDTDDFHAATPNEFGVDITKRDLSSTAEANSIEDALIVPADTTRVIEIPVRNTGTVPLYRVILGDVTETGPSLENLTCTFPNGDVVEADENGVVRWEASISGADVLWNPGVEFLCTGELTISAGDPWHSDTISVSAETLAGDTVGDDDPFVAGVPGIDIVKFDGRSVAPANAVDGPSSAGATPGDWAAGVDADTDANAVRFGLTGQTTGPRPVSMIITNTGAAELTNINVADDTLSGPALAGLTCDFTALGGPASGVTWVGPFLPGESFLCVGTLELGAGQSHADSASVTADAVVTDVGGETTTVTLSDSDEFHAKGALLALTGAVTISFSVVLVMAAAGIALVLIGRRRRATSAA